ncbi:MAG: virulence factor [Legionellaceae bacterium]|nr:virulence factor [Legionellaceae bacterium]
MAETEEEETEEEESEEDDDEDDDDDDADYSPDLFKTESDQELLNQIAGVYQIWWNWAHFELSIISPHVDPISPCVLIMPEPISTTGELEFVYPICDYGNALSTSKGTEMYSVGMSMCRLFYTIEKMIFILVERLKEGGISTETEIQISFDGHQLAQRKAFESVINLSYNVVVTNFDPGAWGERYLEIVKRLADKGYGYPSEAPRDVYKNSNRAALGAKR